MDQITLHTRIIDLRRNKVVRDNWPGTSVVNYNYATVVTSAQEYANLMPDCTIIIQASNGDHVIIPAVNMIKDSSVLSHPEFMAKWYGIGVPEVEEAI